MVTSERRNWVPLFTDAASAVARGPWTFEEFGMEYRDKTDLALLSVEFTALGFGHYYINGTLTTWDWKHWRFHEALPFEKYNLEGSLLLQVDRNVRQPV